MRPLALVLWAAAAPARGAVGWGKFRIVWYNDLGTLDNHHIDSLGGGDVDGDGRVDLVFSTMATKRLVVAFGDGAGRFNATLAAATPEAMMAVAVGDADGDGDADVATAGDGVWLWARGRGASSRTWAPASPVRVATYKGTHSVALADVDGDGGADVVVASQGDGGLWLDLRGGAPRRVKARRICADAGLHKLVAADVDGDGNADVVSCSDVAPLRAYYGRRCRR